MAIKSSQTLVSEALQEIKTISTDAAHEMFKGKLDLKKEMVLFCAGGLRSALAAKSLKDMGFEKVSHIDGGFGAIKQSKFKII